jgi:hypothetical protein
MRRGAVMVVCLIAGVTVGSRHARCLWHGSHEHLRAGFRAAVVMVFAVEPLDELQQVPAAGAPCVY